MPLPKVSTLVQHKSILLLFLFLPRVRFVRSRLSGCSECSYVRPFGIGRNTFVRSSTLSGSGLLRLGRWYPGYRLGPLTTVAGPSKMMTPLSRRPPRRGFCRLRRFGARKRVQEQSCVLVERPTRSRQRSGYRENRHKECVEIDKKC